ncbi:MAG: PfkB family carbohydrate kinase [Planctomycetota bacterium]
MALLVTGSIAIDTVRTPFGASERCLGGSAVYFSMAASFFAPVRLVGVIGPDCPFDLRNVFKGRTVDLAGLEVRQASKTFRWAGSYSGAMNEAITENVALNVLAERPPDVPEAYRDSRFVFLANTAPALQMQLLSRIEKPLFVAADTMNCWIDNNLGDLEQLLAKIDALIFNDTEARMLTKQQNTIAAAAKVLEMGPSVVIIKKGEHGSVMATRDGQHFALPAYPTAAVKDPTGAGDAFAGALMGYLAKTQNTRLESLKKAIAYGTVLASFTIEDFSLRKVSAITTNDIEKRFDNLRQITSF